MLHNGFYDVFAPMETPRLRIRKLGIGDAEDIFTFSQNPEVSRFVLWDAHRSIADSRSMVRGALRAYRMGEPASLAIELRETGRVVGTIGFVWIDDEHNCAEIGYSLARDCWGQGLIPEAVKEIIRHAFADLGYQALWAAYYDGNRKSKRVMQKCGMTYRLSRIEAVEQLGETRLAHYFAVTRREWER